MRIELHRLARAVHLDVERLSDHRYRVTGGEQPHVVDLRRARECDCEDATYQREYACQHLTATMLYEGDRDAIRTLRYWVPRPGARRLVRQRAA